jgi:hypothetical protein
MCFCTKVFKFVSLTKQGGYVTLGALPIFTFKSILSQNRKNYENSNISYKGKAKERPKDAHPTRTKTYKLKKKLKGEELVPN